MSTQRSSSKSSRRRRRSAPPPRLSWPSNHLVVPSSSSVPVSSHSQPNATTGTATSVTGPTKSGKKNNNNATNNVTCSKGNGNQKRQRNLLSTINASSVALSTKTRHNNNKNDTNNNQRNLMWVDQYAPTTQQELCVAPKKVQEVMEWLQLEENQKQKLLILMGRPGCGKSTMLRVLCREMGISILEWDDTYSSTFGASSSSSFQIESVSPMNSFERFLQQSGAGYASLLATNEMPSSQSLLDHCHDGSSSSNSNSKSNSSGHKQVILWEEFPNVSTNNPVQQERCRTMLTQHVARSNVPTIWIYSDGTEGQHKPADLEQYIAPHILYNPQFTKLVQINPVTKPQLRKCLDRIAKAEGFSLSKDFCEHLQLQSGGDVRFAIHTLQFDQATNHSNKSNKNIITTTTSTTRRKSAGGDRSNRMTNKKRKTAVDNTTTTISEHIRDTRWTAFHALGKIMYAKREPITSNASTSSSNGGGSGRGDDGFVRPPLTFDPEQVVEQCDMDLGHVLTYLEFHSVDFFTDVTELSTALDLYSDASYLLEQTTNYNYQRRYNNKETTSTVSCPIFPEGYVTSLVGRTMAYANQHAAPSRFRSLSAPKILEVRRKRNENAHYLERLQYRLSLSITTNAAVDGDTSYYSEVKALSRTAKASLPSFIMDKLPFLRTIVPQEVNASLEHLHTSGSGDIDRFTEREKEEQAAEAMLEKEQQGILKMDDIDEFDSDDEGENNIKQIPSIASTPLSQQQSQSATSSVLSTLQPISQSIRPVVTSITRPLKPITKIVNPYHKPKIVNPYNKTPTNPDETASSRLTAAAITSDPQRPIVVRNPYARETKTINSSSATTTTVKGAGGGRAKETCSV